MKRHLLDYNDSFSPITIRLITRTEEEREEQTKPLQACHN